MTLANDQVTIRLDGEAITLRPSLRAALRLARKYETFAALATAISEGSVTAICDVMSECARDPGALPAIMADLEDCNMLAGFLAKLQAPLLAFVMVLAGANEATAEPATNTKPVPFTDYFEQLFEIGTGFLGWTPNETWHATPAEIIAAHKGRMALLKMIFGSTEADTTDKRAALTLDEKARLAFSSVGIRKTA